MKQCRRPLTAAVVSAVVAGTCSIAFAEPPATQPSTDVSQELAALRARIDQLEKQQKQQEITQQEAVQQSTVNSVLSDADHRSKLFDSTGFSAGYKDNRFFIGSDDGNFVLRPWYHLQVRNVTLDREDLKKGHNDDVENGFEIRRIKIGLDGNMFSPDFTYFFNWATSRANGTSTVTSSTGAKVGTVSNGLGGVPILEEAWVKYNFHDTPFYIKGGQIKDPLLHDQVVSSRYQHSAERSLTADLFANGDAFTEGVTFIYDPKTWVRTEAGINHGLRSANTNFLGPTTNGFNYGVAGRAEFKVMGRWQDYSQVGDVDVKDPLLVFGVGTDYSERGHAGQTVSAFDGQYADPSGLLVYGAVVNRYTTHNFGVATLSATGASFGTPDPKVANQHTEEYSLLGEVGYTFGKHLEPFGRYEVFKLAGTPAGSHNYFQAITAGANWFFVGHRAKLTAEVIYLPHGIPIDDTASDVLTSVPDKGEISGVVQFQLLL